MNLSLSDGGGFDFISILGSETVGRDLKGHLSCLHLEAPFRHQEVGNTSVMVTRTSTVSTS
jgi:hypothetical protein